MSNQIHIIQNAITTTISEIFRGDFRRICEVKKAVLHLEAIYFCHGTCYLLKRENMPIKDQLELLEYYQLLQDDYASVKKEIPKHPLLKVSLVGELNTYAMFAELASRLTEKDGFAAIIVKSALVTSTCYSSCFRHFVNQGSLSEVFLFDNREKLFQIDSREKFCVLFFGGEHAGGIAQRLSSYQGSSLQPPLLIY